MMSAKAPACGKGPAPAVASTTANAPARPEVAVISRKAALALAAVFLMVFSAVFMVGCAGGAGSGAASGSRAAASSTAASSAVAGRGAILSGDGVVLAETQGSSSASTPSDGSNGTTPSDGSSSSASSAEARAYPLGSVASPVVGSCYTAGAPDGIEQLYADDLLAGNDVQLTIDSRVQEAAFEALGGLTGSVVVLDATTGAVLAMASTPAYDPSSGQAADDEELANRACELHIPGSTFKTITLAAALEGGIASLDSVIPAPAELVFEGGAVSNYDMIQYSGQTLLQAYAKSINTVFAQLTLTLGFDNVAAMARSFGFEQDIMPDFNVRTSTICDIDEMSARMQAWSGVGQALYQPDGSLQGPVMSPVQGAVVAAVVANGGTTIKPYLVESVGGTKRPAAEAPQVLAQGFLSPATVDQLNRAMHEVVVDGTGRSAAVFGADVAGKTGTAETANGVDDGWFIGFAECKGKPYAFAVLVEGAQSSEAAAVASKTVESLLQ